MSLILPYEEKLFLSDGAFISPEGKIKYVYKGHEKYAQEYCNGKYYSLLSKIQSDAKNECYDESSIPDDYWNHLKRKLHYEGERQDVDPYRSSSLTKKQLELYKLWIEHFMFTRNTFYSDFMIHVLGFDKVETVMRRTITTSSRAPHVRFFNYYLMGDNILVRTPEIYSEEKECFVPDNSLNPFAVEEGAAKIELDELHKKVLKKDLIFFTK